ncbi:MAG: hypothetical protein ACI8TQ_001552 [Planctomycetota bacterium]|jgi:hypothetical protein
MKLALGRISIGSLALTGLALAPDFARADVILTEFMASNSSTLLDEDGASSDWIEIWNSGPGAVDLAGWNLTDDALDLVKWTFPTTVLPADARIVVFASSMNKVVSGSELHTNFKLSASGEYLALVEPGGAVIATQFSPTYSAQTSDVSYGLASMSVLEGYFEPATPGLPNPPTFSLVPDVTFSHPRGYQTGPISVALADIDTSATIYYTLDGSEPSEMNGLIYASPILISDTSSIRAIAVKPFSSPSTVTTSTYIYSADVFSQTNASAVSKGFPANWLEVDGTNWTAANDGTHPGASYDMDTGVTGLFTNQELEDALMAVPSVSLVMGAENWFGYAPNDGTSGIYANSTQNFPDSAWVRKCSAEWIDPTTGQDFQINCGVNIQGGSSPGTGVRSQLSIALKFKSEYGPTKLEFKVFPDSEIAKFDYLLLDGGNQNSIHENVNNATKIHAQGLRDQFMMDMQGTMDGLEAHGRYVHLYLDGLYWGLYDLHERPDERFAAEYQGGASEEYDWVKEGFVVEGNSNNVGSPAPGAWKRVIDIVDGGVGPGVMYNGVPAYDALASYVNLEDYADYMLLNFYGGNQDWPQRNWYATSHSRLSADNFDVNPDLEFIFHAWDEEVTLHWGGAVTAVGDGFYDRTGVSSTHEGNCAFLYTALRQNPRFNILFADRAHHMLFNDGALYVEPGYDQVGTVFNPAFPERNRPASTYHKRGMEVQSAIILEYARWGNYWHPSGTYTPTTWLGERTRLLNSFFPIRSNVLLAQLRNASPQMYPTIDAPVFNQHGGNVAGNFLLEITLPGAGEIAYTLDGSDPRTVGGLISPTAISYMGPVLLPNPVTTVRARAFGDLEWSALNEATFGVGLELGVSEIMADNLTTVTDELGQFEDYIEIYNGGTQAVDLSGMFLTDNPLNTTKWEIPAGTVVPIDGRVVVWADEDGTDGPLHANFKLSALGEYVGLYTSLALDNMLLAELTFGAQTADISVGTLPDDSTTFFRLLDPSPFQPNFPGEGVSVHFDDLDANQNVIDLAAVTAPIIGQPYQLAITGAPVSSAGVLLLGSTISVVDTGIAGVSLINAVLPQLWKFFTTSGSGTANPAYNFPNSPSIVGLSICFQAYVEGSTLSNAVVMTFGM